jgi:hypothetical protein
MSENQPPDRDRSAIPVSPMPPNPLDYGRVGRQRIALPMICGMILGVAGILVVGFAGWLLDQAHFMLLAIGFFILGAVMLAVFIQNVNRKAPKWFLIGLLLGTGVMSLIEGLCFMGS